MDDGLGRGAAQEVRRRRRVRGGRLRLRLHLEFDAQAAPYAVPNKHIKAQDVSRDPAILQSGAVC